MWPGGLDERQSFPRTGTLLRARVEISPYLSNAEAFAIEIQFIFPRLRRTAYLLYFKSNMHFITLTILHIYKNWPKCDAAQLIQL